MKKFILFCSGVGTSKKNNKTAKIFLDNVGIPYKIIFWQEYVEGIENRLLEKHGCTGNKFAKFVKKILYKWGLEACIYKNAIKNTIQAYLKYDYELAADYYDEVILIGFSWGSCIAYDFIQGHPRKKINKLITIGSPLPFEKAMNYFSIDEVDWTNYYEKSDGFAHKMLLKGVHDVEWKSRNILKCWNPFAHGTYLNSKRFAKMIKQKLID